MQDKILFNGNIIDAWDNPKVLPQWLTAMLMLKQPFEHTFTVAPFDEDRYVVQ